MAENLCNKSVIYFFSFVSRYRRQICGLLLSSFARIQRLRLSSNHRLWHVRSGQTGSKPSLPVSGQVHPNQWCRNQTNCKTLLQIAIPECPRLWIGEWRGHRDAGEVMLKTAISGHWQVWRHRSWTQNALWKLSQFEKVECKKLWHGQWCRNSKRRLLLPRPAAAQHPRLPRHGGRIPDCEEVLQAMHHWALASGLLLAGSRRVRITEPSQNWNKIAKSPRISLFCLMMFLKNVFVFSMTTLVNVTQSMLPIKAYQIYILF